MLAGWVVFWFVAEPAEPVEPAEPAVPAGVGLASTCASAAVPDALVPALAEALEEAADFERGDFVSAMGALPSSDVRGLGHLAEEGLALPV